MTITITAASPSSGDAVHLLHALDDELRRRYPDWNVQGLRVEDADSPRFVFLVAHADGAPVACGAVRELERDIGEVKRMFVRDEWRRRGVARQLLAALESKARDIGYTTLRIETGALQPEAITLYRSAGYTDIAPYGGYADNPVSMCFEKRL